MPKSVFPFLFGGTFIEGHGFAPWLSSWINFPSFSEGLSLRVRYARTWQKTAAKFPFLFGGTFIEGSRIIGATRPAGEHFPSFSEGLSLRGYFAKSNQGWLSEFPFLFGGTFIEGELKTRHNKILSKNFPSFSEGLSLRVGYDEMAVGVSPISLPFRRDFH